MLRIITLRNVSSVEVSIHRIRNAKPLKKLAFFFKRNLNFLHKVSLPTFWTYPTGNGVLQGLNLKGKKCLITGANSGIGFEITKSLAEHGCDVTLACRNAYAAQSAIKRIGAVEGKTSILEIDLASLKSVKKCAEVILSTKSKLDIVVLNAGTFGMPFVLTEDDIETTLQVNHLSQFYLLLNLEYALAAGARVVFVSSRSHRNVDAEFFTGVMTEEMLNIPEKHYTAIKAYNVSKLCNVLAVQYLAHKWADKSWLALAAHPGTFVNTNLCRNWWVYKLLYSGMIPFSKSAAQAASTPLYCATSLHLTRENRGWFYSNCKPCRESELTNNSRLAFRVNDVCMKMISMRVGLPPAIAPLPLEKETTTVKQKEREDSPLLPAYH